MLLQIPPAVSPASSQTRPGPRVFHEGATLRNIWLRVHTRHTVLPERHKLRDE